MVRPRGKENRIKENDPRWSQPRFLERIETEVPTVLVPVWDNPPKGTKVVWFALPDPQGPEVIRHYYNWAKHFKGVIINHPMKTYMPKRLWYFVLNQNGIRAPFPRPRTQAGGFQKPSFMVSARRFFVSI